MPTALRALRITFASFLLVAGGLAGAPGADAQSESPQTARAALGRARQEARRWHADAELIGVGARVDTEGFSNNDGATISGLPVAGPRSAIIGYQDGWNYIFSSPSAHQRLHIRVYSGGLATVEEQFTAEQPGSESGQQKGEISKPLPPDFLDSDRAMAVVRKSGFSVKDRRDRYKFRMELTQSLDTPVNEPFCWRIADDEGTSFFVSAKSAKLLAKVPAQVQ